MPFVRHRATKVGGAGAYQKKETPVPPLALQPIQRHAEMSRKKPSLTP